VAEDEPIYVRRIRSYALTNSEIKAREFRCREGDHGLSVHFLSEELMANELRDYCNPPGCTEPFGAAAISRSDVLDVGLSVVHTPNLEPFGTLHHEIRPCPRSGEQDIALARAATDRARRNGGLLRNVPDRPFDCS
jgi:hypothetical protein